MKQLLVITFFCLSHVILAQQTNITLIPDHSLDSLIEYNKQLNAGIYTTDGFRIQLYSGNNRTYAEDLKAEIFKNYPQVSTYLSYQQPHFKLRVGDFRNRFEALKLYHELLAQYNQAIIVPDKINLPKQ
ncbi:MAG: SPOR domain-containing protein [Bacteroidia bacterium]